MQKILVILDIFIKAGVTTTFEVKDFSGEICNSMAFSQDMAEKHSSQFPRKRTLCEINS